MIRLDPRQRVEDTDGWFLPSELLMAALCHARPGRSLIVLGEG
ncbi:hypothetical protein ACU635_55505 [[Actinomadura] parvosata]